MKTFAKFELSNPITQTLSELGFTTPTPIQEQAIPILMQGHDLIGCAATGTGKTLAFALPIISKLEGNNKRALILAPTRELAIQIESVFLSLMKGLPQMRTCLIIGGASMRPQIKGLQLNPQILIATPGRLVDHIGQGNVSLGDMDTLVLDEADRMLDMGFAPQIDRILRFMPKERQNILFSATFPSATQKLTSKIMRNPKRVTIGQVSKPVNTVKQTTIETTHRQKNDLLLDVLNESQGPVLIFVRTKNRTDRLHSYLEEYGYAVSKIHGGRSQAQRNSALAGFKENKYKVLVATDVAARGIDVSNISRVINFDLPPNAEDYIHRIGRSGRAGMAGEAISFLTPEDRGQWREISKGLR